MNIRKATVTFATATLLLAACGKPVDAEVVPAPAPTTTTEVVPTPSEVVPTEEYTPDDFGLPKDIVTTFGKTVKWDDGISVSVSEPKPYTPGEYAAGAGKWNASVKVTLTNGTKSRFDPADVYISASDGSGDLERVFDSNLEMDPSVSLRPGKSVTWKIAYGLHTKSLTGITVEASRMLTSHSTVIFEN